MPMLQILKDYRLPFILMAEIILCLMFGDALPLEIKSGLYGLSLALKEILITLLPLIIFAILASNLSVLSKGAFAFTAMAFACVILSNFCSTMIAGAVGTGILGILTLKSSPIETAATLQPIWDLPLWSSWFSQWHPRDIGDWLPIRLLTSITNDMGLFAGISVGLILAVWKNDRAIHGVKCLHDLAFGFFRKLFIPIIPLFILGYILNMQHSGILATILENYLLVVVIIALMAYAYIIVLYGISVGFKPQKWMRSIRELIPAAITGFSTMSSASALPLVIEGVRQNTKGHSKLSEDSATGIVPISINIHLIGDCFTIPVLALAILTSFGYPLPSLMDFFIFTIFFVLAKFAVAAVPGGGILVMIPILEKYLGFTPDMISLITALYILFDPMITSANIFGNGAFASLFHRTFNAMKYLFSGLSPAKPLS